MKTRLSLGLVALALIGGSLFFWGRPPSPAAPTAHGATTVVPQSLGSSAPVPSAPATNNSPAETPEHLPNPTEVSRSVDQAIERIEAAVVTYEASSLPVIAPFLTHSNPELRRAAREGMLQMGADEASPLLRAAAEKLKDPREATLLLDAADFLDLPPLPSGARPDRTRTATPPPTLEPGEPTPR